MIDKVSQSALLGIQRGMNGMRRNAHEIATAPVGKAALAKDAPKTDLARSLVELKQHAQYVKANAKVLQTAGDTIGALLDIKA